MRDYNKHVALFARQGHNAPRGLVFHEGTAGVSEYTQMARALPYLG